MDQQHTTETVNNDLSYNPETEAQFEVALHKLKPYFMRLTILKRFYQEKILNLNFVELLKQLPNQLLCEPMTVNLYLEHFDLDKQSTVHNNQLYAPSLKQGTYTVDSFTIKIKRYSSLLRVYIV